MWKDFKSFLLRGNLLDLAVAVVVGVRFYGPGQRPGGRHHHAVDRRRRRQAPIPTT